MLHVVVVSTKYSTLIWCIHFRWISERIWGGHYNPDQTGVVPNNEEVSYSPPMWGFLSWIGITNGVTFWFQIITRREIKRKPSPSSFLARVWLSAVDWTWTSTTFPPLAPQASVSTKFHHYRIMRFFGSFKPNVATIQHRWDVSQALFWKRRLEFS